MLQNAFGNSDNILDSNLITADLLSRIELNPFGHINDAVDASLLNYLGPLVGADY